MGWLSALIRGQAMAQTESPQRNGLRPPAELSRYAAMWHSSGRGTSNAAR